MSARATGTGNSIHRILSSQAAVSQRVLAPLLLGAFLLLFCLYHWDVTGTAMQRRERFGLDQFHVNSWKVPARDDIVVLGIDDASQKLDTLWPDEIDASPALKQMKKAWQWPRRVWAPVLDKLFEAGARYVFLDLTFKAPSHDPEDDRLLREALERHKGKVIIGGKWEIESVAGSKKIVESTENIPLMIPSATAVGENIMESDAFGLLNFFGDRQLDGVIRKANYWISVNQLIKMGFSEGSLDPTEVPRPSIAMVLGRKVDPEAAARAGEIEQLRFSEPTAYPPLSIHQIFLPAMWENNFQNGAAFKDKIVFIGATASDLQDFQDTIYGQLEGVRLHAHALTALLAGGFVQKAPRWWTLASLALGSFLAWTLVSFAKHPLATLGALLLLTVGAYGGAYLLFDRHNLEASPMPFTLALDFCGVAGLAGNYLLQRRDRQRLHRLLARYTSPEVASELSRDRASILNMLGGTERTVTVLFSDVRGFTSMSENMTPTEIVAQRNEYLSKMVERVFRQKGSVDKFIGDAVMALWGSMRSAQNSKGDGEDARRAVDSALEMRKSLAELNEGWRARGIQELAFGVGIHQGPVVVGNIGSESPFEKMDITVIGDSVNIASRLEGATKQYGVDLIISDTVRHHLGGDYICRSADLVALKGKLKPVEVFTIMGTSKDPRPAGLDPFEEGIVLYRAGDFAAGKTKFEEAEAAGLVDQLTFEYINRCSKLLEHPPEKWNGVYTMKSK